MTRKWLRVVTFAERGVNLCQPRNLLRVPSGVWFFGIRLVHDSPRGACLEDWGSVLDELDSVCHFRHLDVMTDEAQAEWTDLKVIRDNSGVSLPVAVDLENYEIMQ